MAEYDVYNIHQVTEDNQQGFGGNLPVRNSGQMPLIILFFEVCPL